MAQKSSFGLLQVFALVLFALGMFSVALEYASDRSLQKAEIISLPLFGQISE